MSKRSCDRCHRRKEQCTGQNPCERCSRVTIQCTYDRQLKTVGRPKILEKGVRGIYSRNRCVPCSKSKKKCDEGQPSCGNCVKKMKTCWYNKSKGKDREKELSFEKINGTSKDSTENLTNHTHNDHTENGNYEIANLPSPAVSKWLDDLAKSEVQALTPSAFFNATEKMFLESLDFLLEADQSVQSAQSSPPEQDEYEGQRMELLASCMLNSVGIPEPQGELLCYFINEVSMLLFSDKTSTRFLATVIPLCLADTRVRFPILAIASSHRLNSIAADSNLDIMRDAVKYRSMAQCCLAGKNDDFFDDTENVLLSLCLVSIQEIFEGNSLYWSSALEKGSDIIRVRGGLNKVSKMSPLSIQLFCYLDHVSSLSTCAVPLMDRSRNNPYANYNGNHVEDILNCKFGFRYGFAGDLFKIMGNISTLAALRSARHQSPEYEKLFDSLANLIEMKLQHWSPSNMDIMNNFLLNEQLDSHKMTLSSYWLALQWSCFLRLHQIRQGYNRQDSRVSACLSIILKSLKSIENSTLIETGLMFPLIMAGLVCVEQSDRDYILSRIRSIKEKLRFSYIGEFERLLHAVWARDNDEGDFVNWAKIRFYQFPGLVMF